VDSKPSKKICKKAKSKQIIQGKKKKKQNKKEMRKREKKPQETGEALQSEADVFHVNQVLGTLALQQKKQEDKKQLLY